MSTAPPTARDFMTTAAKLAGEITPEGRKALAAAWPADWPHPAVVAHALGIMLADTHVLVSRGFTRMALTRAMDPKRETKGPSNGC